MRVCVRVHVGGAHMLILLRVLVLLDGHDLAGMFVAAFHHNAVGARTNSPDDLILLQGKGEMHVSITETLFKALIHTPYSPGCYNQQP